MSENLQFLAGGGELGRLTREKNWNNTSLGPPEFWPQSLRTTLSILLNSRFPMFLFWGEDLICFYNDAYRPSLGKEGKHPAILGMRGAEAWVEIWHIIKPLIDQVLGGGAATFSEDQLIPIYRNGKIEDVYWTFSYSPVNDESGKAAGIFVTCTETTDKINTYNKLRESKLELEFAIDAAGLGTWDYNPLTNKFTANDRLREWFGLPPDEQIELAHALNAIRESDRDHVSNAIQKALDFSSGGKYNVEYTIVHPVTKQQKIIQGKGKVWFNDQQVAYRFTGTLEDVTEQAIATKKIRQSDHRFQAAINAVQGILWTNNAKGEMEGEQPGWSQLTGQTYSEYQGYGWTSAVHPDDAEGTIKAWHKAVAEVSMYKHECRVKVKDGTWRNFLIKAVPLVDQDGVLREWVGVHTDITDQKLAEAKIVESERRYFNLIASSPFGIGILKGQDLIITTANDAMLQLWGKGKEIVGKPYFKALPEFAEQGYSSIFNKVYQTGVPFNAVETPLQIVHNGHLESKYYNLLLFAQRDINAEIDGIGIIATEVTSHALLNEQIRASERRFRLLADSMPQHVWTSDSEGNFNYLNQSGLNYTGLTKNDIKNDGWLQIVHPDDRDISIQKWKRSVQSGSDYSLEHRFRKHTGEYHWQLSRAVPMRDENGKIQMWVGTSTDIQAQKMFTDELEKEVEKRTNELEVKNNELSITNKELQSFAYISSHDLQEPLRKVQTFASRIVEMEYQNLSERGRDYFKRIQFASARMQTLIQDLLVYSRTSTAEKKFEKTDLNKLVMEILEDFKEEMTEKGATLIYKDLGEINIIPFQFRQLLHNMVSNSLKFRNKGVPPVMEIKTEIIRGSKLKNSMFASGCQYCHLSFSDNGIGFDQCYAVKVFDLFQRLHEKSLYEGTGTGLAIVKKIVDNHNGVITVDSKPDVGTTFDIYIPTDRKSTTTLADGVLDSMIKLN